MIKIAAYIHCPDCMRTSNLSKAILEDLRRAGKRSKDLMDLYEKVASGAMDLNRIRHVQHRCPGCARKKLKSEGIDPGSIKTG